MHDSILLTGDVRRSSAAHLLTHVKRIACGWAGTHASSKCAAPSTAKRKCTRRTLHFYSAIYWGFSQRYGRFRRRRTCRRHRSFSNLLQAPHGTPSPGLSPDKRGCTPSDWNSPVTLQQVKGIMSSWWLKPPCHRYPPRPSPVKALGGQRASMGVQACLEWRPPKFSERTTRTPKGVRVESPSLTS